MIKERDILNQSECQKAREHAASCYPNESCGVVVGGKYIPMENKHSNPDKAFYIDEYPVGIEAVIHSHPDTVPEPSASDMRGQIATAVPWGIIKSDCNGASGITWYGDQVEKLPLIGRPFLHGRYDCFSLGRDYYKQEHGISIPDVPRDREWWANGKDDLLNELAFVKNGFIHVPREEVKEGDAILMRIGSKVVNHCSIFMDNGLLLHHLYGRLSAKEPQMLWIDKYAVHFLRHKDMG